MINWQAVQTILYQTLTLSISMLLVPVWTLWSRLNSTAHRRKNHQSVTRCEMAFLYWSGWFLGYGIPHRSKRKEHLISGIVWLGIRHDSDIIFIHVVPPAMHLRGDKATAHCKGAVARTSRIYVDYRWLEYGANLPNISAFQLWSWERYISATTTPDTQIYDICKSLSMQVALLDFHTSMLLQLIVETTSLSARFTGNKTALTKAWLPAYRYCWNGCLCTPTHHHESPGASQPVGLRQCFLDPSIMVPQTCLF